MSKQKGFLARIVVKMEEKAFSKKDTIEKYGFRISWLRTVHTSLPWSLEFEEEINRKYEQKKRTIVYDMVLVYGIIALVAGVL